VARGCSGEGSPAAATPLVLRLPVASVAYLWHNIDMTRYANPAPAWIRELNALLAADKAARAKVIERKRRMQRLKRSRRKRSAQFMRWFVASMEASDNGG
jgi:hypothetical protein